MSNPAATQKPDELVVFEIVRASTCAECGDAIDRGQFLRLEAERPLCLSCADLGHLVFLPRGDAALTRRATKYSPLKVVVVRFSRARQRYERQGLLVTEVALNQAETECLADVDARARQQERRSERAAVADIAYRAEFARRLRELFPHCPELEAVAIADHACAKYSGRVGRSADAKRFEPDAITLAVRAHVRHVHTHYDRLLSTGWDRHEARADVASAVEEVLESWGRGLAAPSA